jgi:hypothetical protein
VIAAISLTTGRIPTDTRSGNAHAVRQLRHRRYRLLRQGGDVAPAWSLLRRLAPQPPAADPRSHNQESFSMHHFRSIRRLALGAAVAGAAVGAVPALASAASTCSYDPALKRVTVTDGSGAARLRVVRNGVFLTVVDGDAGAPHVCSAGNFRFAAVSNTDRIVVNEFITDRFDGVTIDESNGEFSPGATPEADRHSEIEIVVSEAGGLAGGGRLSIIGTPGNDVIRITTRAVSLQSDLQAGNDLDEDSDIIHPAGIVTVEGRQGSDFLSGQGFGGLRPTLEALDLEGGAEDDTIFGGTQGDNLFGEDGKDTLNSVDGANDFVSGGTGFDNAIHDAIDRLDGVESEATGSVGRLALAPRALRARAGKVAPLKLIWTHPKAWRELRAVQVRLYRGGERVGIIAARPRDGRLSAGGAVKLARGSRVTHHGATVGVHLALRLARSLSGEELRVAVQAWDRHGHTQIEPAAGVIKVAK